MYLDEILVGVYIPDEVLSSINAYMGNHLNMHFILNDGSVFTVNCHKASYSPSTNSWLLEFKVANSSTRINLFIKNKCISKITNQNNTQIVLTTTLKVYIQLINLSSEYEFTREYFVSEHTLDINKYKKINLK